MTFDELLDDARELLNLRPDGWTAHKLHDLGKLAEETGEVAECMVKSRKTLKDLGEELSDVITVCAVIALRANIDLAAAHVEKQDKRVQKILDRFHNGTYPADVQRG